MPTAPITGDGAPDPLGGTAGRLIRPKARAVVFAYHDVGVRCLLTLMSGGVEVPLVVTVADDPNETQWFGSVAATAADYGIEVITPADANTLEVERAVAAARPDFIFSFYYRSMLGAGVLDAATRGALNMHGSLLPKYRGRAPVNWAILHGARETGATLHYMVSRADAGDIVDQLAVPILQDDDAREVFSKVTVAAETVLARSLPGLIAGTAPRRPQPIEPGQYFGRRRPQDGRIEWSWPATQIHNLVRAVAPPFPGAFAQVRGERWDIYKTRVMSRNGVPPGDYPTPLAAGARRGDTPTAAEAAPGTRSAAAAAGARSSDFTKGAKLFGLEGRCYIACVDGSVLQLLSVATAAGPLDLRTTAVALQAQPVLLD